MTQYIKGEIMLFIRTTDSSEIITKTGIISFDKNKRKGNVVKKFRINKEQTSQEDAISYFEEKLLIKMIPKNSQDLLEKHPIKLIETSNNNILIFQDLDCHAKFLVVDNDTGKIKTVAFDDLIAQEDTILCYSPEDQEWYFDDVESIFIMFSDGEFDDGNSEAIKSGVEADEFENMELSKYIINSENGIIINNIFVS